MVSLVRTFIVAANSRDINMSGNFLTAFIGIAIWTAAISTAAAKWQPPPPGTIRLTAAKARKQPIFRASYRHRAVGAIPECFDARERWPQCQSIADIRDQAGCGSCWAVSSASVLSDRICIAELAAGKTPSQTYVSAVNFASCGLDRADKDPMENCKKGGSTADILRWSATRGYITGGSYNSKKGCKPYPVAPANHDGVPFTCSPTCTNPTYNKTIKADTAYIDSYWVSSLRETGRSQASIDAQVIRIQQDILANGPVVGHMNPYKSLYEWKPEQGAYHGEPYIENKLTSTCHAVRIIGWCKDKNNVKYWKILNSWGTSPEIPGRGEMWFEMGKNVAEIEEEATAPIITLPDTCKSKSICDSRITQFIRQDATNLSSPIYAFYDNCVIKAAVAKSGQISLVGESQPIERLFVGGPAGPIVQWSPEEKGFLAGLGIVPPSDQKKFAITNAAGMVGTCTVVEVSGKFECDRGENEATPQATTVVGSDTWTFYSADPARFRSIYTTAQDSSQDSIFIGTKLTKEFTIVDTFLNIDDSTILVCGLDRQEKPACSTMKVSTKEVTPAVPVQKMMNSCPAKKP